MKFVTALVVFAGIISSLPGYTPPTTPSNKPAFASYVISPQPLSADPDDEEDDRVKPISRRKPK